MKYEEFYHHEPFTKFNRKRAIDYKAYLLDSKNKAGDPLSIGTTLHYLKDLQEFLKWLGRRTGYKSKINFADIEYLNLTDKDKRKTQSNKVKIYPALDDIRKVIFNGTPASEIEMRDRALIAFTITTGVRDGVLIGLKLKHIDIVKKYIIQNPNEVETKYSKTINTKFFPVGADIHQVVIDWVNYLKNTKGFNDNHPLFPKTDVIFDEYGSFSSNGISKEHWQSVTKIREIFKEQFGKAGLAYHSPHKFRDTLSVLGQKLCNSPEKMMAWCKNLGHEQIGTTFGVYGYLSPNRQFELIERMAEQINSGDDEELKTLLKTYLKDKI